VYEERFEWPPTPERLGKRREEMGVEMTEDYLNMIKFAREDTESFRERERRACEEMR